MKNAAIMLACLGFVAAATPALAKDTHKCRLRHIINGKVVSTQVVRCSPTNPPPWKTPGKCLTTGKHGWC